MLFGDNRDLMPVDLRTKEKYHPHIKSTVSAFARDLPDVQVVLDVGARDGYAVELLRGLDYDATGIDIVNEYVEYAQAKNRLVVWDDIMHSDLQPESYDAIFSRHCIEHCSSGKNFLASCYRLLKPGGALWLTFPLETRREWAARKRNDHLSFYPSKDAFRAELADTQFCEVDFRKSKSLNIIPEGREVRFVGKKLHSHA